MEFAINLNIGGVNICLTPSKFSSNISVSGGGFDSNHEWSDIAANLSGFDGTLLISHPGDKKCLDSDQANKEDHEKNIIGKNEPMEESEPMEENEPMEGNKEDAFIKTERENRPEVTEVNEKDNVIKPFYDDQAEKGYPIIRTIHKNGNEGAEFNKKNNSDTYSSNTYDPKFFDEQVTDLRPPLFPRTMPNSVSTSYYLDACEEMLQESNNDSLSSFESVRRPTISKRPALARSHHSLLHTACNRPNSTCKELLQILREEPLSALYLDMSGRLPLHCIAQNTRIFESSPREELDYFVRKLFKANPNAIIIKDKNMRIPFTNAVAEWVSDECISTVLETANAPGRTERADLVLSTMITPFVEWCLSMLSSFVENVSELPDSKSSFMVSTRLSDEFSTTKVDIVENVMSIPFVLQTILLIEDKGSLQRLYEMPLLRRLCLRTELLSRNWIIPFLRSDSGVASRAIDYFELISDQNYSAFFGFGTKAREKDISIYHEKQEAQFQNLLKIGGFIPSMGMLQSTEQERATATSVIRRVLDDEMVKSKVIGKVFSDFVLHIIFLVSFRVFIEGELIGREKYSFLDVSMLAVFCGAYFIFQDLISAIHTIKSYQDFLHYISDLWNLVDLLPSLFVIITTTLAISGKSISSISAIAVGLVWLKVIGFLKTINMQFATYIFSIAKITQDILWFIIVMYAVIMLFSDMAEVLLSGYSDNIQDLDLDSFLVAYNILIGDTMSREGLLIGQDIPKSIILLYLIFTILGVIVMLNMLIAIVSDSYEKSILDGQSLLGRGRLASLTKNLSMEKWTINTKSKMEKYAVKCGMRRVTSSFLNWVEEIVFVLFSVLINIIIWLQNYEKITPTLEALLYISAILLIFATLISVPQIVALIEKGVIRLFGRSVSQKLEKICACLIKWMVRYLMGIHNGVSKAIGEWHGRTAHIQKFTKGAICEAEDRLSWQMKGLEDIVMEIRDNSRVTGKTKSKEETLHTISVSGNTH